MKNKDNSILEIDRWLKLLKWAAFVGIGVFALILTAYAINFRAFDGIKSISNLPNDWSAFGSLLSGASSLLGAIGTVGVMLLAINQFKIQQNQILEQSQKQADFESKQFEKWAEEARILKFQLFLSHQKQFEDMLLEFEASSRFRVNKRILYDKIFPNNNSNYVSFKSERDSSGACFIVELNDEFATLHKAAFNEIETNTPENLVLKLKKILKTLSLFCEDSDIVGDIKDIEKFNRNTGINIFNLFETIENIKSLINSINTFSEFKHFCNYNTNELKASYKLEMYYLNNTEAIYTTPTVKGLIELAKLQIEFKKHIHQGLSFSFDIFHNQSSMEATLEQWDRIIYKLNIEEHDIEKIKELKKSFIEACEFNSTDDYLLNSRRNRKR